MKKNNISHDEVFHYSIGFLYSFFTFLLFCKFFHYSDMLLHQQMIEAVIAKTSNYSLNFMFYFLSRWLSVISPKVEFLHLDKLGFAMVLLMSAANCLKFFITAKIMRDILLMNKILVSPKLLTILTASLMLIFSIPCYPNLLENNFYYIGQLPPQVWHNSTVVFLMPFALLLFWVSYQQLIEPTVKRNFYIILLVLLNISIKPSFFFLYMTVFPLMYFTKYQLKLKFLYSYLPVLLGVVFVFFQYVMIYWYNVGAIVAEHSSVAFGAFKVWAHYSPTSRIPLVILTSLLFPICFGILFLKKLKNILFVYSFLNVIVGVLIFSFIYEKGPRMYHGNFFWQIVPAVNILYIILLSLLLVKFKQMIITFNFSSAMIFFLIFIYSAHVISGIFYVIRFFYTKSYY
jgi:hypothetical protein